MTKADKRSLSEPRLRKFTPSNSAEDFIERAATQSSFSGRPYLVNCGGNERPSADWLKEELHLLRGGATVSCAVGRAWLAHQRDLSDTSLGELDAMRPVCTSKALLRDFPNRATFVLALSRKRIYSSNQCLRVGLR